MLAILIDRKGFFKYQEYPGDIPPPEIKYPVWTKPKDDYYDVTSGGTSSVSSYLVFRRGDKLPDGSYEYLEA